MRNMEFAEGLSFYHWRRRELIRCSWIWISVELSSLHKPQRWWKVYCNSSMLNSSHCFTQFYSSKRREIDKKENIYPSIFPISTWDQRWISWHTIHCGRSSNTCTILRDNFSVYFQGFEAIFLPFHSNKKKQLKIIFKSLFC